MTWRGRELFKSDRARTSEKYAVLRHEVTTELSGFHLKHETLADTACFTPTLAPEVIAKGRWGEKKKISFLIDNQLVSQSSWGFNESMGEGYSARGHVPRKVRAPE